MAGQRQEMKSRWTSEPISRSGVRVGPSKFNGMVARATLQQDLGELSDPVADYCFGETVRDRLIAHARQDAAHALLNTISALETLRTIRRLLIACLAVIIYIAWRLS